MTTPNDSIIVFVNEVPVRIGGGASATDAVGAHQDRALAEALAAGRAYLTDGRGIRLGADEPVTAGAILRVVLSARQAREPDADA